MVSILKIYQKILQKYPVVIHSIQTGFLMGGGDFIAQTLIEKKSLEKVNYERTLQFIGIGAIIIGPTLTVWYKFLSKTFGDTGKSVVLKKVAVDQLVFAPTFQLIFINTLGLVQRKTFEQTKQKIKRDYFDILLTNYTIWPWVQLGNFYFVPLHYQVLVVQCVALFWNCYLSHKTQTED